MTAALKHYLIEVLGIKSFIRPEGAPNPLKSHESLSSRTVSLLWVGENLGASEQELIHKMAQAMKLQKQDYQIMETPHQWSEVQAQEASLVIQFKQSPQREKFYDVEGVVVLYTHTPQQLLQNPELKKQTWSDLKMAMRKLNV